MTLLRTETPYFYSKLYFSNYTSYIFILCIITEILAKTAQDVVIINIGASSLKAHVTIKISQSSE